MTQSSRTAFDLPHESITEAEHRADPRGRAPDRTHARTDRPRMLRPGEVEPSWQVFTFPADVPRSIILEAARDACDELAYRDDEVVCFLVDRPGGEVQLRVRGHLASAVMACSVLDVLRAIWPEVVW